LSGCSKGFKHGRYNTIFTAKGLYEHMFVPEIELSIPLNGRGFIQRHIRLSRSKFDVNKKAELIEMISNDTSKTRTDATRKKSLRNEGVTTCDNDIMTVVIR
jgi:hypothetical protein